MDDDPYLDLPAYDDGPLIGSRFGVHLPAQFGDIYVMVTGIDDARTCQPILSNELQTAAVRACQAEPPRPGESSRVVLIGAHAIEVTWT
jgi:hypothetical protein